ncbi:MAG: hypothetical protein JWQ54_1492 [Mucilaginibacter sp.]|nr:hypothetical protein [Mucilaginibacter sp.]
MDYSLKALKGSFAKSDGSTIIKIYPKENAFNLDLSDSNNLKY